MPMSLQDYLEEAQEHSLQANYERAMAAYNEAIRIAPRRADGYYGRGYCYYATGRPDQAIADFLEGVKLDPTPLDSYARYVLQAYGNRSLGHRQQGDHDRAIAGLTRGIADFREMADADPLRAACYDGVITHLLWGRAEAFQHRGDHDLALADFTEVGRRCATPGGYYFYLRARSHFARGAYASAVADYEEALRLGYTGYADCVIEGRDRALQTLRGQQ
jgi:tetratricopeptide (TPR) repeat protein